MATVDNLEVLKARWNDAKQRYKPRNDMILLMQEMYQMVRDRKSSFMGAAANKWRSKVAPEYWQSSSRPQNAVDIAVAILAGNWPQFKVSDPGAGNTDLASRAEKFLLGLWHSNSRRQGVDLVRRLTYRTILDGAAGIRVTWSPQAPQGRIVVQQSPEKPEEKWATAHYPRNLLPLCLDIIPWNQLYPMGGARFDSPYGELIHASSREPIDVKAEWDHVEGANLTHVEQLLAKGKESTELRDYVEWWKYNDAGQVTYMVMYDSHEVIPKRPINYPRIPYIISAFKEGEGLSAVWSHVPFLVPIIYAVEREEYIRSRLLRMMDMLAGLMPYSTGAAPVTISGTWGEVWHMDDEKAKIQFPQWPGNPPDVWKLLEDTVSVEGEGTFSSAMFGSVPTRISGYGLSQLIGADTLRMDTPRANLELAFSSSADLIFQLLQEFCYGIHMAVTFQTRGLSLNALLAGRETEMLLVNTYVKPKQSADEIRMATIGSQLASLPKPPVSMHYILENFFGIAQPQDQRDAVLAEQALDDPMIRLFSLLEVLKEQDSEYVPLVEAQLQMVIQKMATGGASGGPGSMPQMGMGMPQATGTDTGNLEKVQEEGA